MNKLCEEGIKKTTRVVLSVSDGVITREFVRSLCKYTNRKVPYTVDIRMCGHGEYDSDIVREFKESWDEDVLVVVKPYVGFSAESIDTIVDSCVSNVNVTGVAVPVDNMDFKRLNGLHIKDGVDAKALCCRYDLKPQGGYIRVQEDGTMKVDGFQRHDIIGVHKDCNLDIRTCFEWSGILYTNFTCYNGGTHACLLDHLRSIINIT